jgi:hypothetical protein
LAEVNALLKGHLEIDVDVVRINRVVLNGSDQATSVIQQIAVCIKEHTDHYLITGILL